MREAWPDVAGRELAETSSWLLARVLTGTGGLSTTGRFQAITGTLPSDYRGGGTGCTALGIPESAFPLFLFLNLTENRGKIWTDEAKAKPGLRHQFEKLDQSTHTQAAFLFMIFHRINIYFMG